MLILLIIGILISQWYQSKEVFKKARDTITNMISDTLKNNKGKEDSLKIFLNVP